MAYKIGKRTIKMENDTAVECYASMAGKKESEGPIGHLFDKVFEDEYLGQKTYEMAESELQKQVFGKALEKGNLTEEDIDHIFSGDLLNQCSASNYGLGGYQIPHIGIYGACSTMALGLALSSCFVDTKISNRSACVTSSHFCSSERQFRLPLEYGGQRTPSTQWTVSGAGAAIVSRHNNKPIKINSVTFGKIVDKGITDVNNMGAAMAPDDVKIRPYPRHEGMVFFYTQIQYLRGFRALFKYFKPYKLHRKNRE